MDLWRCGGDLLFNAMLEAAGWLQGFCPQAMLFSSFNKNTTTCMELKKN
jgi:hypothetical protein